VENITGEESKLIKALIDMKGKGNLNDLIEQTALLKRWSSPDTWMRI